MAGTKNLHDALVDELRDLYHAEKQLVRALPKMARAAAREELRDVLENHLAETEHQLTRLERVFEHLDERPRTKPCTGMAGIIEAGSVLLKEDFPETVMDAQIIAAAQRVKHYEMAAYGTVAAWADQLGRGEVANLLREILEQERDVDTLLTSLAENGLHAEATSGVMDERTEEVVPGGARARGRGWNWSGPLRKPSGGNTMGRAHRSGQAASALAADRGSECGRRPILQDARTSSRPDSRTAGLRQRQKPRHLVGLRRIRLISGAGTPVVPASAVSAVSMAA